MSVLTPAHSSSPTSADTASVLGNERAFPSLFSPRLKRQVTPTSTSRICPIDQSGRGTRKTRGMEAFLMEGRRGESQIRKANLEAANGTPRAVLISDGIVMKQTPRTGELGLFLLLVCIQTGTTNTETHRPRVGLEQEPFTPPEIHVPRLTSTNDTATSSWDPRMKTVSA